MWKVQCYLSFCLILTYQITSTNGFTLPFTSFSASVVPRRPSNSSVNPVRKLPTVSPYDSFQPYNSNSLYPKYAIDTKSAQCSSLNFRGNLPINPVMPPNTSVRCQDLSELSSLSTVSSIGTENLLTSKGPSLNSIITSRKDRLSNDPSSDGAKLPLSKPLLSIYEKSISVLPSTLADSSKYRSVSSSSCFNLLENISMPKSTNTLSFSSKSVSPNSLQSLTSTFPTDGVPLTSALPLVSLESSKSPEFSNTLSLPLVNNAINISSLISDFFNCETKLPVNMTNPNTRQTLLEPLTESSYNIPVVLTSCEKDFRPCLDNVSQISPILMTSLPLQINYLNRAATAVSDSSKSSPQTPVPLTSLPNIPFLPTNIYPIKNGQLTEDSIQYSSFEKNNHVMHPLPGSVPSSFNLNYAYPLDINYANNVKEPNSIPCSQMLVNDAPPLTIGTLPIPLDRKPLDIISSKAEASDIYSLSKTSPRVSPKMQPSIIQDSVLSNRNAPLLHDMNSPLNSNSYVLPKTLSDQYISLLNLNSSFLIPQHLSGHFMPSIPDSESTSSLVRLPFDNCNNWPKPNVIPKIRPVSLDLKIMSLPPSTISNSFQGIVTPLKRNNSCSKALSSLPEKSTVFNKFKLPSQISNCSSLQTPVLNNSPQSKDCSLFGILPSKLQSVPLDTVTPLSELNSCSCLINQPFNPFSISNLPLPVANSLSQSKITQGACDFNTLIMKNAGTQTPQLPQQLQNINVPLLDYDINKNDLLLSEPLQNIVQSNTKNSIIPPPYITKPCNNLVSQTVPPNSGFPSSSSTFSPSANIPPVVMPLIQPKMPSPKSLPDCFSTPALIQLLSTTSNILSAQHSQQNLLPTKSLSEIPQDNVSSNLRPALPYPAQNLQTKGLNPIGCPLLPLNNIPMIQNPTQLTSSHLINSQCLLSTSILSNNCNYPSYSQIDVPNLLNSELNMLPLVALPKFDPSSSIPFNTRTPVIPSLPPITSSTYSLSRTQVPLTNDSNLLLKDLASILQKPFLKTATVLQDTQLSQNLPQSQCSLPLVYSSTNDFNSIGSKYSNRPYSQITQEIPTHSFYNNVLVEETLTLPFQSNFLVNSLPVPIISLLCPQTPSKKQSHFQNCNDLYVIPMPYNKTCSLNNQFVNAQTKILASNASLGPNLCFFPSEFPIFGVSEIIAPNLEPVKEIHSPIISCFEPVISIPTISPVNCLTEFTSYINPISYVTEPTISLLQPKPSITKAEIIVPYLDNSLVITSQNNLINCPLPPLEEIVLLPILPDPLSSLPSININKFVTNSPSNKKKNNQHDVYFGPTYPVLEILEPVPNLKPIPFTNNVLLEILCPVTSTDLTMNPSVLSLTDSILFNGNDGIPISSTVLPSSYECPITNLENVYLLPDIEKSIPSASYTNYMPNCCQSKSSNNNELAAQITNTLLASVLANLTASYTKKTVPFLQGIPEISLLNKQRKSKSKRPSKKSRKRAKSRRNSDKMLMSASEDNPAFEDSLTEFDTNHTSVSDEPLYVSILENIIYVGSDSEALAFEHTENSTANCSKLVVSLNDTRSPDNLTEERDLDIESVLSAALSNVKKRSSSTDMSSLSSNNASLALRHLESPQDLVEYIVLKELMNSDVNSNWDLLEQIINIFCEN